MYYLFLLDGQTGRRTVIRTLDRAEQMADLWVVQQLSIQPDTR